MGELKTAWKGVSRYFVCCVLTCYAICAHFGFNSWILYSPDVLIYFFFNVSDPEQLPDPSTQMFFLDLAIDLFPLGGLIGSLLSGFMGDRFGRKGSMVIINFLSIISVILLACDTLIYIYEFTICTHLLTGICAGVNFCLIYLYLCEIAPRIIRGGVIMLTALFINLGNITAQILSFPKIIQHRKGWFLMIFLAGIIPVVLIFLLPRMPESPRYLLIQREDEETARHDPTVWQAPGPFCETMPSYVTVRRISRFASSWEKPTMKKFEDSSYRKADLYFRKAISGVTSAFLPCKVSLWSHVWLFICFFNPGAVVLQKLKVSGDVEEEIEELRQEENEEKNTNTVQLGKMSGLSWHIFSMIVIMGGSQLVGFHELYYHNYEILLGIEMEYKSMWLLKIATNVFLCFISLLAAYLVDYLGRRTLFLLGLAICTVCLVLVVVVLALLQNQITTMFSYFCVMLLVIFIASYTIGPSIISIIISLELFLQSARASAFAISGIVYSLTNILLNLMPGKLKKKLGSFSLLLFTPFCVVTLIFIYVYIPETKNQTFKDIKKSMAIQRSRKIHVKTDKAKKEIEDIL